MSLKDLMYIFGFGMLCGYYGLTCFMFIITWVLGYSSVTIHFNLFGEMNFEVLLTVFSIPFAVYAIKDTIDRKKRGR